MALVSMTKIRLISYGNDVAKVLETAQRCGVLELTEVRDERLTKTDTQQADLHRQSARVDFAVEFLEKYASEKGALRGLIEGDVVYTTAAEIENVSRNFYVDDVVEQVQNLQVRLNDLVKEKKELLKEFELLEPWEKVPFRVGADLNTARTATHYLVRKGKLPETKPHKDLNDKLKKEGILSVIMIVDERHILLTVFKSDLNAAEDIAKSIGYETVEFEQRRGTPREERERIRRRLVKIEKLSADLVDKAAALAAEHLEKLKMIADYLYWQKERSDVAGSAARTQTCAVFEGWCPAEAVSKLKEAIAAKTQNFSLDEIKPRKEEVPPVEIENGGIVRPFEAVTRLYGLPGHKDLDPTPYLAGFFFVFFGFCLTDVGYGAILAALTGFVLWRYRLYGATKTLVQLLFLGGLASLVMGLIFGGYMGIDTQKLPQFLQKIALFNPLNDPIPVFYVALALGVIHILFGLVLAVVRARRNGRFLEGLLDHGPWILLFLALGLWGAENFGFLPSAAGIYLVYAALAALVLTQGRKEKSLLMKPIKGIMSLYDSVGYFSDVLSYSRLLALGLATSALAFAVNLIADIIGEMVPVVGTVVALVILIVGHLFNLMVNALGAFIHSARLQFVEFFGKFITGTGKPFEPFTRRQRNVVLEKEVDDFLWT